MKKLFKWIGVLVAVLVLLVVAAALILPSVIDPNDYRDRIAAELTGALGREVKLDGPLSWSVFPWIAIEAEDVSLANAPGFGADPMVSVDRASARVKLLPLIRGNVQVGLIVLDQPAVNLQVDANGVSNWAGLTEATGSDSGRSEKPEPQDEAGDSLNLRVQGIQIVDASARYTDLSSDFAASVSDLDLTTGVIDPDAPLDLDLSMQVAVENMLEASLSMMASAEGLLGGEGAKFNVSKMDMEGRYQTGSGEGLPIQLSLEQPMSLDQGSGELTAKGLVLGAGDLRVVVNVGGNTDGTLTGELQVPELNLQRWLNDTMGQAMTFSDPSALTRFAVQSAFSLTGSRAKLEQLNINLDDTLISGSADLTDYAVPAGSFMVMIDAIDVDRYLPPEPAEQGDAPAGEPLTLEDLAIGELRGQLKIGELKVAGLTAGNVALVVNTSQSGINIEPLNASLYDGKLETRVRLGPGPGGAQLVVNQKLAGVQAGPLLTDLLGQQYMTGTGNLDTRLQIFNVLGPNPLAESNGSVSFVFEDGAIFGMDVVGALQRAAALLDGGQAEQKAGEEEQPATKFSRIELVANIKNGILTTQTLALESPILSMDGDVTIDLAAMSISGEVRPTLVDPAGLGALERFAGVPIPVRLSGPLSEPGVSVDPAKLALASQKQKVDEKKDEVKKKLLNSLFGDDDDG